MEHIKHVLQIEPEELFPLVGELAEKYTGKESTSVSEETARMLFEAVCYCIREAEEEGVSSQTAAQAYEKGYELVLAKLKKAEQLYRIITEKFQAYENEAYYDTIIKGMPAFFLRYNPKFKPQDHLLTLDYPLLSDNYELCGIDRIYDYLLKIRLEQRFLEKLPTEYIRQCLMDYWADYEELLINICQLVLQHILKSMLAEKPLTEDYSEAHCARLKKLCEELDQEELKEKLNGLLKLLIERQYGGNAALYEYLAADLLELAAILKNSEAGGYL